MQNMLILFGFCWMVVAALVGFLLAKRRHMAIEQLDVFAAQGNLGEYHWVSLGYHWNKTVHAHTFLFSVVAVCIGLAMTRMNYTETVSNVLAIAMMLSPAVWTLGGMRSNKVLMVIGDTTLLISIVMAVVGLATTL